MSTTTSMTSMSQRVGERARTRRRSRAAAVLWVLTALALLAGAAWVVLASGLLGVGEVRVLGVERLTADEVRERAAVPAGTPLARVDTDAVRDRVRSLDPVLDAEVTRAWPRTLEVLVRERRPAAVQARGGGWALLDRSGVAFATEARRPRDLPLVSAPTSGGRDALRAGLDVLEVLPATVRADVRSVRAGSPDDVRLALTRGRTVVWGSRERSARKAAVLRVLLTRKASVYDVSAPDIPTTRK